MGTYGLLARNLSEAHYVKTDEELGVVLAWFGGQAFGVFDLDGVLLDEYNIGGLTEDDWRDAKEAIMVHLEEMREERLQ